MNVGNNNLIFREKKKISVLLNAFKIFFVHISNGNYKDVNLQNLQNLQKKELITWLKFASIEIVVLKY